MDDKKLSSELGLTRIEDPRRNGLENLNLLEIPGIRRCLTQRERVQGMQDNEIPKQVRLVANAIRSGMYSRSYNPSAKRLGKLLRWMAVRELYQENYGYDEMAVILPVKPKTIRADIRQIEGINKREWWYQMPSWQDIVFPISIDWEFTPTTCTYDESDNESFLSGDGK